MRKIYSICRYGALLSIFSIATQMSAQNPDATFRRKYTDTSSRYFNSVSYTVGNETKTIYEITDAKSEDYYVTPANGSWQTDGAYIDMTDKVIEIPEGTTSFTLCLHSNFSGTTSTKWSQVAVLTDWNNNKLYTDEGETNGVLYLGKKPNESTFEPASNGNRYYDEINVPASATSGNSYSLLVLLNEPKGYNGTSDMWGDNWEWTEGIFNTDNLCSLINGQAYGFTVKINGGTVGIDNIDTDSENIPAEYFNLQGMPVKAENLTSGIYIMRKGGKASKVLIK